MSYLPPPIAVAENARYRVAYGVLGQIGEIRTSIEREPAKDGERLVRVEGSGEGSILGMGQMHAEVDAHFDVARLASRRWRSESGQGSKAITDVIDQPGPGELVLARRQGGGAPERLWATLPLPVLDPLGFILRVRLGPPAPGRSQVLHVMEGQALWRITLTVVGTEALPEGAPTPALALRLDGKIDPITYEGNADEGRAHRRFTLWLSNDAARVPLRMSMSVGPGHLVVDLIDLRRDVRVAGRPAARAATSPVATSPGNAPASGAALGVSARTGEARARP